MLLKVIKQLKNIFVYYPKRHFSLLLLGITLFIGLFFISNLDLKSDSSQGKLLTKISIDQFINVNEKISATKNKTKNEAIIKRNDSLFSILTRLGIQKTNIFQIINSKNSDLLTQIKIGKKIEVEINELNEVVTLNYIEDFKSGIRAKRNNENYFIERYTLQTEKLQVFKNVTIINSLYVDGLKQDLPDSVIMDLVYIFGWDIDFVHDIRPGDSYSLIYEEVYVDGQKVLEGDVLIAEFFNQERNHTAIRYKLKNGSSEYFTPEGRNVKKAFLRSPVKFSYISSKYNLKRNHPVLHQIRAHTGVDYAAIKGTPVRATGDGTVVFAGTKGGYGNLIEIKHTEDYSTRYAHLDKFHPKIRVGKKVKQSDRIGYVGRSGIATGDHLHYEFRVNGKHTNPLTVRLPNADPINLSELKNYSIYSNKIIEKLRNYQNLSL